MLHRTNYIINCSSVPSYVQWLEDTPGILLFSATELPESLQCVTFNRFARSRLAIWEEKRKNPIAIAVPLGEGSQQVKVLPKKSVMDTNYVGTWRRNLNCEALPMLTHVKFWGPPLTYNTSRLLQWSYIKISSNCQPLKPNLTSCKCKGYSSGFQLRLAAPQPKDRWSC